MERTAFKRGSYPLHQDANFNFQLNRVIQWDGGRLQDVLIFGASKDHFIPQALYSIEIDALPHVKSLTYRLMTEQEDGAGHCNVGNPKLVLDTVLLWLEGLRQRDETG
ncbi:MAG: hypothetical protein PHO10_04635 [Gemmiger sp.]|nr:hypothetical protein [Gemmiger sp.]